VVVNVARGALIDTNALADALQSGSIKGAGLDVTEPEPLPNDHRLFTLPNCVITSHSADTPEMTKPLLAERVRFNVDAFISGRPLRGVVSVGDGY
jgi:phosphoglycerate dehydrogenase-like enzyme